MEILVLVLAGSFVVGLAVLLYLRSVASRRTYTCPSCGEIQTVELMDASRCSHCGAPLGSSER